LVLLPVAQSKKMTKMSKNGGDKLKEFVISLHSSGRLLHLITSGQKQHNISKSSLQSLDVTAQQAASYFAQLTGDKKYAQANNGGLVLRGDEVSKSLISFCARNRIDYNEPAVSLETGRATYPGL
jgi:hypothetical protein